MALYKSVYYYYYYYYYNKGVAWRTDNAWNNARCTKARKATHGPDGQHQDVDTTLREESIRMTEINGESTSMVWPTRGSRTAKDQNSRVNISTAGVSCIRRQGRLRELWVIAAAALATAAFDWQGMTSYLCSTGCYNSSPTNFHEISRRHPRYIFQKKFLQIVTRQAIKYQYGGEVCNAWETPTF